MLEAWAYLLDDHRRILAQSERAFVEHARSSGWPDSEIGRALLTDDTDLTRRVAELDEFVRRPGRPGPA